MNEFLFVLQTFLNDFNESKNSNARICSEAVGLISKCVFTTCFIDLKNWCLHAAILLSPGNRFGTDWGYWVFSFKQKLLLCLIELLEVFF